MPTENDDLCPAEMSWTQRRDFVRQVATSIERHGASEQSLCLLSSLAEDTKWEVRKEVADALLLVPEDHFPRLTAKLVEDSNLFVRTAAERALDRRRRGVEVSVRKQKGLTHVQSQYETIEKKYGPQAADMALRMAERLYDTLVGATVHDMKNILTPLKSGISMLKGQLADGNLDAGLFKKYVDKMENQSGMLLRMIEDILTYSQLTPDQRHRERISLIVAEAHGIVIDAFKASDRHPTDVTIAVEIPENLMVDVARYQMVRAISNIIKNAYEAFADDPYTFRPGQIRVVARPIDRDRIEIIITDNGMGLPAEELNEVRQFIPGGTSKKTHGTGFGLPIAKRKIEDHRGSLIIDSTEAEGTTVIITLPSEAAGAESNEFSCVGCG
jgi:signal transduction histidine kinase